MVQIHQPQSASFTKIGDTLTVPAIPEELFAMLIAEIKRSPLKREILQSLALLYPQPAKKDDLIATTGNTGGFSLAIEELLKPHGERVDIPLLEQLNHEYKGIALGLALILEPDFSQYFTIKHPNLAVTLGRRQIILNFEDKLMETLLSHGAEGTQFQLSDIAKALNVKMATLISYIKGYKKAGLLNVISQSAHQGVLLDATIQLIAAVPADPSPKSSYHWG